MSQSRSARKAKSFRNQPRKISESARRNRRLFLEPLEQRALLTVLGNNDLYTTSEDTVLFITAEGLPAEQPGTWLELPGVLYNDIGTSLTAQLLTQPQYGEVTLYPDGSFEYIPLGNSNLTDSFTYHATDGVDFSDPVTVQIEITPVNDPPLAIADTYTTSKNSQLTVAAAGVLLNDVEPDDEPLSATLGTPPEHGTLTFNGDGSFTYTPEADYFGSDSFTYLASDGTLTNETTVSLTIVDQPPEVPTKAFTAQENSPLTVAAEDGLLAGVTDPDNTGATFVAVLTGSPTHGTAEVDPDGSFTYTPIPNYSGPDEFVVQIAPVGGGQAAVVVVGINVLQNNQAPVAGNDQFVVAEDHVLNGNVLSNDTDPDSTGSLSAVLVAGVGPESGTLTLNANGTFSFMPLLNFFGTVYFTYKLVDGNVPPPPENLPVGFTVSDFNSVFLNPNGSVSSSPESNVATVAIDVTPVNDVPVSPDLDLDVPEDSQVVEIGHLLSDVFDPDNETWTLTPVLITWPSHGTVSISGQGSIVYTPYPGFVGEDEFTFIIGDGEGWSEPVTGSITIDEVNDPPVAADDVFSMPEDPLSFSDSVLGNDTDIDGPSLTTSLVSGVAHGSLILQSDGTFIYTPDANYNGTDGFSYALSDGEFTVTASVTLNISPVSDAPVAGDDNFSTDEDAPVSGSLTQNDVEFDNEPLIVVSPITYPTKGSVTINYDGTFTYTPSTNEFGSDSFSYVVYDSYYTMSNVATVNIAINPINDAPTASDQSFTLDEDTSLSISEAALLTGATDPDGDQLSVFIIDQPIHGDLIVDSEGGFTYTPATNYFGTDSFFYVVSDGSLVATATATLDIENVNDAPIFVSDPYEVWLAENPEAGDLIITLSATDLENDALTYALVADTDPLTYEDAVSINPETGVISVAIDTEFDFELTEVLSFVVLVMDSFGGTDSTVVTVNLIDVLEAGSLTLEGYTAIPWNNDDDDLSGDYDYLEIGGDTDDDLVPYTITVDPSPALLSEVTVSISVSGGISLWMDDSKSAAVSLGAPLTLADNVFTFFVQGDATGGASITAELSMPGETLPSVKTLMLHVYDISIWKDGAPLPLTATNVMIGDRINLSVNAPAPNSVTWTLPGIHFESYQRAPGDQAAYVVHLTSQDLHRNEVGFHWIDGAAGRTVGAMTVLRTANKPGLLFHRTATFDVAIPDVLGGPFVLGISAGHAYFYESPIPASPEISVTQAKMLQSLPGGGFTDGMEISVPFGASAGTYEFVQLVEATFAWHRSHTGTTDLATYGGLDTHTQPGNTFVDSPGIELHSNPSEYFIPGSSASPRLWNRYDFASLNADFRTVLLFTPYTPGAAAVPFREVLWSFNVAGAWVGPDYDNWELTESSQPPVEQGTTVHPTWITVARTNS